MSKPHERRRVAAIFAHPDDEILGCGGAMAMHADKGDEVHILILATGLASRAAPTGDALAELRSHAEAAAKVVGARSIEFGAFPDNAMDSVPLLDIVKCVESFVGRHQPDVIYTHHRGDLNVDHRCTHDAVATARRLLPGNRPVEILACEVLSSTEWGLPSGPVFTPTDFLDIATALDRKVEAMCCYAGEIRDWPHPRSERGIRTLAHLRGAQCGRDAAEAYMTVRRLRDDVGS